MDNENQLTLFEEKRNENGITFWWASDFSIMLGYDSLSNFQKVLDRTTNALISLGIKHHEHILPFKRPINGKILDDFKLTRVACYFAAMNGDPKKIQVAEAQAFFIDQTRKLELYLQGAEDVERVLIRDELKESNKSLSSAAKNAGVTEYDKFTNAGYLGLYNMAIWDVRKTRHLEKSDNPQDYMGRTELAANLFKNTQTEERLKKDGVSTQEKAENIHMQVATGVRRLVFENTGKYPENLPKEKLLPDLKRELKKGVKLLSKIDKKTKKK